MKQILLLSLLAITIMSCKNVKTNETVTDNICTTIDLFNGTDLSGWKSYVSDPTKTPDQVYSVVDGVIRIEGDPFGYLYTEQMYENYNLHVEWRWIGEASNSGIFLHVQPADKLWPNAIECQLMAGSAGDFVLLGGSDLAEFIVPEGEQRPEYPIIAKRNPSNEKNIGEWNSADICALGDAITVSINGELQNEATKSMHTRGSIALQSEGKAIEFRNITLTPIQ